MPPLNPFITPSPKSSFLFAPLMGFPSVCYCAFLPKPLVLLVQLLDHIKFTILVLLFHLGLFSSTDLFLTPSRHHTGDHLSEADLPTLTPISITGVLIKRRLPVVAFATFLSSGACQGKDSICAVCLGSLEARHQVRELGSCSHTFHKGCIDKWVDLGQITCPLCRSQLLPKRKWRGFLSFGRGFGQQRL